MASAPASSRARFALERSHAELADAVHDAVRLALQLEWPVEKIEVQQPRDATLADAATPVAFQLASQLKLNPAALAVKLDVALALPASFASKSVNGAYLNFVYAPQLFEQAVSEALQNPPAWGRVPASGLMVVLEYSQPNVGKPFHFGHIRSTLLGDVLARLLQSQGWRVHRMNYLGDSGTQVGKLLFALEQYKDLPPIHNEKDMLEYYIRINNEIEANPAWGEKVRAIQEQIEAADPAILEKLKFVRNTSYEAFQRNYDALGVSFDEVTGESEFIPQAKKLADEARQKSVAFVEEKSADHPGGELVANLEPELSNFVILRSNGTTLYSTRDLALADYKEQKFHPARSVILTSADQNLHFRQVRLTLKKLGRNYVDRYEHIGFGLVTTPEGKMSTRAGRVVLLDDVIREAENEAKNELEERAKSTEGRVAAYSTEEMKSIAHDVAIGALKFATLRVTPEKNILYDFRRMVSFEGDSGAYLQYSRVRAANILAKGKENGLAAPASAEFMELNEVERELAKLLARYPLVLNEAAKSLRPHILCEYLLKLAGTFSSFYASTPVLQESDPALRQQRLALVSAAELTLRDGLQLLGIPVPERM